MGEIALKDSEETTCIVSLNYQTLEKGVSKLLKKFIIEIVHARYFIHFAIPHHGHSHTKAWFSYVVKIVNIGDFSDPRFLRYMRTCKSKHPSLPPTIPVPCHKNRKNQKRFYFPDASQTVPDRLGFLRQMRTCFLSDWDMFLNLVTLPLQ